MQASLRLLGPAKRSLHPLLGHGTKRTTTPWMSTTTAAVRKSSLPPRQWSSAMTAAEEEEEPPPSSSAPLKDDEEKTDRTTSSTNYESMPSNESAAFAFGRLATPGRTTILLEEFLDVVHRMNLDYGLSRIELERVFHRLDENGDGHLSLEEFKAGRTCCAFTGSLVEALSVSEKGLNNGQGEERMKEDEIMNGFPDEHFDWDFSTAECYGTDLSDGFVGENVAIRQSLDYEYHTNYTHRRQLLQDLLIRKNVLLGGSNTNIGTDRPWLVHTCGEMGAGKGWVLGWMSANGYLPLERVSKIDPDSFKLRMPEWNIYQRHSLDVAGTQTHAESGYIAEIAQHVAMNNNMNVWVDGSLRDYEWYSKQFTKLRRIYPHYRIAILAVGASESLVQSRLEERAVQTGRYVPEALQKDSLRGIQHGVRELTPKVDLVAYIQNDSSSSTSSDGGGGGSSQEGKSGSGGGDNNSSSMQPQLKAVSMIDRSGNWELIKELTNY